MKKPWAAPPLSHTSAPHWGILDRVPPLSHTPRPFWFVSIRILTIGFVLCWLIHISSYISSAGHKHKDLSHTRSQSESEVTFWCVTICPFSAQQPLLIMSPFLGLSSYTVSMKAIRGQELILNYFHLYCVCVHTCRVWRPENNLLESVPDTSCQAWWLAFTTHQPFIAFFL